MKIYGPPDNLCSVQFKMLGGPFKDGAIMVIGQTIWRCVIMTLAITQYNNILLNSCTFDLSGLRDGQGLSYLRESIMEKECTKCKKVKNLSEFSRDKHRPSGWTCACKKCRRISCDAWTDKNKAHVRAKARRRYYENQEKMIAYSADWKRANMDKVRQHDRNRVAKDPNKPRSRRAVKFALESGKLQQSPCEVCGQEEVQGHHDSYLKENWLKVRWLCPFHHIEHHKELRRQQYEG